MLHDLIISLLVALLGAAAAYMASTMEAKLAGLELDRHAAHAHALHEDDAPRSLAESDKSISPFSKLPTEIVAMIARAVLIRPEEIDALQKRNRRCPPLYLVSRDFAAICLKFANYFRENTFLITVCPDLYLERETYAVLFLLHKTASPPICKIVIDYPLSLINRSYPNWIQNRWRLETYLRIICDDKSSFKRYSGVARLRPTQIWFPPPELTPEIAWITQAVQRFADELMTRPVSRLWLQRFSMSRVIDEAAGLWQQDQAAKRIREAATQSNTGSLIVDPGEISFQRWKSNLDMEKHAAHMRRLRTFE